jgi:hypothetical protein
MDIHALERLRLRARQPGNSGPLGLNALAETLVLTTSDDRPLTLAPRR